MSETTKKQRSLPVGYRLQEYEVLRELGSGGFGITYLARDLNLHREVVVKENLPTFAFRDTETSRVYPNSTKGEDADLFEWSMDSFVAEARTLARFDHPHIVKVWRVFEANGTAYFVMPRIEGRPFDEVIEERKAAAKPFTEEELRGILDPLLGALEELHAAGFYHRDIKPANLLLTSGGPILIDFGAARQQVSEKSLTVVESPGYTPFEQMQTQGKVGPWSDLYGLAAVLYRALTFEPPPKAMDRVGRDPIRILAEDAEISKRFSAPFLESIDRALAFDGEDRPQSVAEWRAMLAGSVELQSRTERRSKAATQGRSLPLEGGESEPTSRDELGNRLRIGLALATLIILVLGGWFVATAPRKGDATIAGESSGAPAGAVVTAEGGDAKRASPDLKAMVAAALREADAAEGAGELDRALASFELALSLDHANLLASEGASRVREALEAPHGSVMIETEPAGATVSLSGAVGSRNSPAAFEKVPAGTVSIRILKYGYEPESREVSVEKGKATRVSFKLRESDGEIAVTSRLDGALVVVESLSSGVARFASRRDSSPASFAGVPPGRYRVTFRKEGWKDGVREVDVEGGRRASVHWSFPEADRLPEPPPPASTKLVSKVASSSVLEPVRTRSGLFTYGPEMAMDGKTDTAWVEGKRGSGAGEWIEFRFSEKVSLSGFSVYAGYGKNADIFYKNSRIKTLEVSADGGRKWTMSCRDVMEFNNFSFPTPCEATWIRMTIREVYSGSKYQDASISEVSFR